MKLGWTGAIGFGRLRQALLSAALASLLSPIPAGSTNSGQAGREGRGRPGSRAAGRSPSARIRVSERP